CLYFIDNTSPGLSEADVRILKKLATRVNIIPVIARGDTLTSHQSTQLKKAIMRDIEHHKIPIFSFASNQDEDGDDDDAVEEGAELQTMLPFTVIAHEDIEIIDGEGNRIRGRKYPWGIVNCLDPEHCDFSVLRSVLLATYRRVFKDITFEVFYEQYRTERL